MTRIATLILGTTGLVVFSACGHGASSAPPVPLHKGYTAFDSKPVAQPVAAPERPPAAQNKLVPAPPVQSQPLPLAKVPTRYEPPMPLTVAEPPSNSSPARPSEGNVFSVHGVDRSDVLYVRSAPGMKSPVVGEIAPETSGIIGMSGRQQIGSSSWREVKYGNVRGWVNARFLVDATNASDTSVPSSPRQRPSASDRR